MGRIHLGSILGTTITLDFSFLLVVAFFVVTDVQRAGMRYALLWIPVLFLSVLLHELAHAGTIGAFGFGPSQIVLEGIGGVTINQRKARPWQDLIISAAGPVSSFLLAWGIEALFAATPGLRAGVTLVGEVLLARWLAPEPAPLRRAYADLACHLREAAMGLPPLLPRLWHV